MKFGYGVIVYGTALTKFLRYCTPGSSYKKMTMADLPVIRATERSAVETK